MRGGAARRIVPATLRLLGTAAVTGLCVAVVAGLLAPGYRDPARWPLDTAPWTGGTVPAQDVRERTVDSRVRGTTVRAHLFLPERERPRIALVYVHGGGGGSLRNAGRVGRALAATGVAVLVPTKITEGYDALHRDYSALGDDAAEEAAWLRGELWLPPERVGLVGVSEGSWVGLLAAAEHEELRGPLVLVAAPVVTPLEQSIVAAAGRGPLANPAGRRIAAGVLAGGRSFFDYVDVDVRDVLPRVDNRVVVVMGTGDWTLPIAQAIDRLRTGLPEGPEVLLAPGGHPPPPAGWAPAAGTLLLREPAEQPGAARLLGGTELPPEAHRGAPRPPEPSWMLDVRLQLAISIPLALVLTALHPRRRIARALRSRPRPGERP